VLYEDFRRPLNYRVLCSIFNRLRLAALVYYCYLGFFPNYCYAITCLKNLSFKKGEGGSRVRCGLWGVWEGEVPRRFLSELKEKKWEDLLILMNTNERNLISRCKMKTRCVSITTDSENQFVSWWELIKIFQSKCVELTMRMEVLCVLYDFDKVIKILGSLLLLSIFFFWIIA